MFTENTKKRSWAQIVGAIVIFILVIAIVATFVLYGIFKDTNSAPTIFGSRVYIMSGDGMEPRIESGSAVFVKEGEFPQREGNVILCSIDGQLAVVGFLGSEEIMAPDGSSETRYIVKYDKAPAEEKWGIGEEDIIGVAKTYSKGFGAVVRFASSKTGMLAIVIIPCALILIYEVTMFIISLAKKKKSKKQPIIEEPVNAENIKAKLEEERRAAEFGELEFKSDKKPKEKKKFVLEEGYLDKAPKEEPKRVREQFIREAEPAKKVEEKPEVFVAPVLEFRSDKIKITDDAEEKVEAVNVSEETTETEPKIEIKRMSGGEATKREADDGEVNINIRNLSASRIDELMKMLEAEKQRLNDENNN